MPIESSPQIPRKDAEILHRAFQGEEHRWVALPAIGELLNVQITVPIMVKMRCKFGLLWPKFPGLFPVARADVYPPGTFAFDPQSQNLFKLRFTNPKSCD